jgi:DNA-binding NtrC family response regulator
MKVLHLDDEMVAQVSLRKALQRSPYFTDVSYSGVRNSSDFYAALKADPLGFDCILIDLHLGDGESGISVLENIRRQGCRSLVIILSSTDNTLLMTEAIRKGADDFLSKEDNLDSLVQGIHSCIHRNAQKTQSLANEDPLRDDHLTGCAGETMRNIASKLERAIARGIAPLLVRGESGTGKELIADMIAQRMPPSTPFVRINCATIQGDTMESELFGHMKGAFTGATETKAGLFATADGGWIFMDEVARLSERSQASLLRVLESGEIRPLGSSRTLRVTVKVVSATNEDLEALSQAGRFRRDLLERLRSYEILLPPLRERSLKEREEILDTLLCRLNREVEAAAPFSLDSASRRMLLTAPFRQSNVRELWKVLLSAAVESERGVITASCLPRHFLNEIIANGDPRADSPLNIHDEPTEPTSDEAHPARRAESDHPAEATNQHQVAPPSGAEDRTTPLHEQAHLITMAIGSGYNQAELHFFASVLERLNQEHPEKLRSVRLLAQTLSIGRHVASKKLGDLVRRNMLPRSCRHLVNPD